MPWPQNSRTTEKPCPSACFWIVAPMSPRCAPGWTADAAPHRLVRDLDQAACLDRRLADEEHPARVAVIAVLDHRHVDVDDVAVLQLLVAGDAVADDVVHRCAQRRRIRRVPGWCVIERRRNRLLHVDHVIVRFSIDVLRRDPRDDRRLQVIEQFRRESSSLAHSCDVGLGFESDGHHARNSSLMLVLARVFESTCLTITAQYRL